MDLPNAFPEDASSLLEELLRKEFQIATYRRSGEEFRVEFKNGHTLDFTPRKDGQWGCRMNGGTNALGDSTPGSWTVAVPEDLSGIIRMVVNEAPRIRLG